MPSTNAGPSRRALLIGVDHHLEAPPLRGCVNDVRLMASVLARIGGFAQPEVRQLCNEDATRARILKHLDDIVAESGTGTTVVLHFSGWGLRVPKTGVTAGVIMPWLTTGDSSRNRRAGTEYESVIVPHDWTMHDKKSTIRYEEVRARLRSLKAAKAIVVFDAPYSGELLSGAGTAKAVYLGASGTEEICYEFLTLDGLAQGALTYFLAQALLRTPNADMAQLFREVVSDIATLFPFQHPVIQGDAGQLFDATTKSTMDVLVSRREGDLVTLNAGAASGLTAKSRWALYLGDDLTAIPRTEKLGIVELTEVRATDATARILSQASFGEIVAGLRAVEESHFYGEMRLRVAIEPTIDDGLLVQLLRDVEILQAVGPDERADVSVRLILPSVPMFLDGEDTPRTFDTPTWVVEDSQRRLALEPRPAGARFAYELRNDLQKLARYRNILGLVNPNPNSPLAGKIDLVLKRTDSTGESVVAEADPLRGIVVFEEGDRLEVNVRNDHDQPIHLTVLDLGLTTSIHPLDVSSPLRPGESASRHGPLRIPRDFSRSSGVETVKIFATVYPVDSTLLFQDGTRSIGAWGYNGSSTELWQLMDMALSGRGTREGRPVQLPPGQEWTTVQRAFELRRKKR